MEHIAPKHAWVWIIARQQNHRYLSAAQVFSPADGMNVSTGSQKRCCRLTAPFLDHAQSHRRGRVEGLSLGAGAAASMSLWCTRAVMTYQVR